MKRGIEFWSGEIGVCLLEGWARNGLSEREIARMMEVSDSTLLRWKKKEEAIARALEKGREVVDFKVEAALMEKALTGDVRACSYWLEKRCGNWGNAECGIRNVECSEELAARNDEYIEGLLDNAKEGRLISGE